MYWIYRAFEVIGAVAIAILCAALVCYALVLYIEIRSLLRTARRRTAAFLKVRQRTKAEVVEVREFLGSKLRLAYVRERCSTIEYSFYLMLSRAGP